MMFPSSELPHLGPLRLPESSLAGALLRRLGLAFGLVVLSVVVIWLTRSGLRDHVHPDRPLGFVAVLCFSGVARTTIRYSDISHIATDGRLLHTVLRSASR